MSDKEKEQSPRDIIAKLHAMTPKEFSRFMHWHFEQLCKRPITSEEAKDK